MFSHPTVLEPRTPTAPEPDHDPTLRAAAAVGVGGFAVAAVVAGLARPVTTRVAKPSAGWPRSTHHTPGS